MSMIRQMVKQTDCNWINILLQFTETVPSAPNQALSEHIWYCIKDINVASISLSQPANLSKRVEVNKELSQILSFRWGKRDGDFSWPQQSLWEESLPEKGSLYVTNWLLRKEIHQKVTRTLNTWTQDMHFRSITLKAAHTMFILLL